MKLEFEYMPIDSLKPYEKNARKHGEFDIGIIKKSIQELGFNDPIGVWGKDNIIVEGHGRLMAAKELGMTEVPVIHLDHLTDEQRKLYALEHNRSAEMSTWDVEMLMNELDGLDNFDLEGLGFGEFLMEEEPLEVHDDDFDEDEYITKEACSKLGDIYVLGNHRLMCGDSTKEEMVKELMQDEEASLLLTDPPYNVDYEGQDGMKIDNDDMSLDAYREFLSAAFLSAKQVMNEGASFYIWFAGKMAYEVFGAVRDTGWEVKQMPIWKKNTLVLGRSYYQFIHEPCVFGWNGGSCRWYSDRKQVTVWEYDKPRNNDLHPTMKPVELFAYLIKNSSKKEEIVLDLFTGSGTTMIACEQMERKARCMEFDPRYVDVIVKRYLKYIGSHENCYLIRNGEKMPLPQEFISVLD